MASTMATTMVIYNAKKAPIPTAQKPMTLPQAQTIKMGLKNTNVATSITPTLATSTAIAGAIFTTLSSMEPALAAQQIAEIAEGGDNRGLALLLPIVPAIGWVLYNILQPALNQFNRMRSERAVVIGLGGLGLGLSGLGLKSQDVWAAQEMAQIGESSGSDNRGLLLLIVVLPAIGWVLFNILQPALNQLNRMRSQ